MQSRAREAWQERKATVSSLGLGVFTVELVVRCPITGRPSVGRSVSGTARASVTAAAGRDQ